ncbi:MAG: putative molybdenum carrier protein, partial [bacterium]
MRVSKIVSGGQTGADRGGLDAAIYCGLPYGGWVPKGRRAEDGVIPEVYGGMRESGARAYLVRTEANVADSDATVVFCYGLPGGGSRRTVAFAVKHRRPHLVV